MPRRQPLAPEPHALCRVGRCSYGAAVLRVVSVIRRSVNHQRQSCSVRVAHPCAVWWDWDWGTIS